MVQRKIIIRLRYPGALLQNRLGANRALYERGEDRGSAVQERAADLREDYLDAEH